MFLLKVQYLCASPVNQDFDVPEEMVPSQNVPESLWPSASPDLKHLYELVLGTPWDAFPPQIAASVDDRAGLCTACSASTSLPPPIPPPQDKTFPPPNWHKIPQKAYDHGRKQWYHTPLGSISFSVNGRPGVNMGNALRKVFMDLDGRDGLVLQEASRIVSCRLSVCSSRHLPPCVRVDEVI